MGTAWRIPLEMLETASRGMSVSFVFMEYESFVFMEYEDWWGYKKASPGFRKEQAEIR